MTGILGVVETSRIPTAWGTLTLPNIPSSTKWSYLLSSKPKAPDPSDNKNVDPKNIHQSSQNSTKSTQKLSYVVLFPINPQNMCWVMFMPSDTKNGVTKKYRIANEHLNKHLPFELQLINWRVSAGKFSPPKTLTLLVNLFHNFLLPVVGLMAFEADSCIKTPFIPGVSGTIFTARGVHMATPAGGSGWYRAFSSQMSVLKSAAFLAVKDKLKTKVVSWTAVNRRSTCPSHNAGAKWRFRLGLW